MQISAGTRLGQYEILSRLGAGGMGEVYRARDTRLGRDVAVKALSGDLSPDAQRLSRFETEARSASALNHPNIVTIHEVGRDSRTPFIVMELVEGRTLRDLLHGGALPVRKALNLAAQLADALAQAHEAGVVHRDLKPENVMVTRDGFAKILDFGLAKVERPPAGSGSSRHGLTITDETRDGAVVGTAGYMSPEQASGYRVDFRSDQFSFGALVYEMLSGRRAFQGPTRAETLVAVIREEADPLPATLSPRAGAAAVDRRTLPGEASRGTLRLDPRPRARSPERPRPLLPDRQRRRRGAAPALRRPAAVAVLALGRDRARRRRPRHVRVSSRQDRRDPVASKPGSLRHCPADSRSRCKISG